MIKVIFIIATSLLQLEGFAQKVTETHFVLSGTITNSKKPKLYLKYENINGIKILDSCKIIKGKFQFEGEITEPKMAIIKANSNIIPDNENLNITTFLIEPSSMTLTLSYDNFKHRKLVGSKTEDESNILAKLYDTINRNTGSIEEKYSKVSREYIHTHLNSFVSLNLLSSYKGRWLFDSVKSIYRNLSLTIQNTFTGKKIKEFIDNIDDNNEGQLAKEFNTIDINGNAISLRDFKGKYVLLDFWGSWCIPCRQSFPHLKELYKEYANKGLNIIGIAEEIDNTDSAWRDAVKKDGTDIWFNLLSNKPSNNDNNNSQTIVQKFAIHSFPTKLLIDPKGTIIGRYVGTESERKMDKKLVEIFE